MIDRYVKKKTEIIAYYGEIPLKVDCAAFEKWNAWWTIDQEEYWESMDAAEICQDLTRYLIHIEGEFFFERLLAEIDSMIRNYEE